MKIIIPCLLLLTLAACSGYDQACDNAGRCLEVWRVSDAVNTTTAARLVDKQDMPLPGTTVSVLSGWTSGYNPASALSTAADAEAFLK